MVDSIATVPEFRTLVLTGGEPLIREDLCDIIKYARDVGFEVVIATNGTLLTEKKAKELSSLDIAGVAISLDSCESELHDNFRGVPGAWRRAIEGAENARREGLYLHINITLSKLNFEELHQLLHLADKLGSHVVFLYQFQPFGRGSPRQDLTLDASTFLKVIETVASLQSELNTLVIPVGLPEYFAYLSSKVGVLRGSFGGCMAGRGMFYVKWYGDVWPCVFLQTSVGNLLKEPAIKIWKENELLIKLRDRRNLDEPCKSCIYVENCGGCRSRAFLLTGSPFAADPMCPFYGHNSDKVKG
ncbi:MAG: radical SAM protein [Candidatus Korarchaeota archaeon NZ13-K]|nr:MAG: radical SAM protein [Candidatus Korarchaeota archaeon NZ13-K]